jgi:hypothetical protein
VSVAAQAFHFEIEVTGIERVVGGAADAERDRPAF